MHTIQELLEKYEAGLCTEEEFYILEEWCLSGDPEGISPPFFLQEEKKAAFREELWQQIVRDIGDSGHPSQKSFKRTLYRVRKIPVWKVAAAMISGIVLWMAIHQIKKGVPAAEKLVSVTVPRGQIKKISLPDHSTLWLNGGSTVQYPVAMNRSRKLYLKEGEIFIEAAPEAKLPLSISTASGIEVKVLGTAFSIKNYSNLSDVKVAVLDGRVQVRAGEKQLEMLTQQQGLSVNKQTHAINNYTADPVAINGWTKGRILLDNVRFDELTAEIEHYYNVQVVFENPELEKCKSSISFSDKDNLEQVLHMLQILFGIHYSIDNKSRTVIISGAGCVKN